MNAYQPVIRKYLRIPCKSMRWLLKSYEQVDKEMYHGIKNVYFGLIFSILLFYPPICTAQIKLCGLYKWQHLWRNMKLCRIKNLWYNSVNLSPFCEINHNFYSFVYITCDLEVCYYYYRITILPKYSNCFPWSFYLMALHRNKIKNDIIRIAC